MKTSEIKHKNRGSYILHFPMWILFLLVILAVLTTSSFADEFDNGENTSQLSQDTRKQKEKELQQLRERMEKLKLSIQQKIQEKDSASQALQKIELSISQRANELKKILKRLRRQQKELRQLQKQKANVEHTLMLQRNILTRQIRAAYMIGRQEYVKLLLNQENPAAIGRTLTYYDYFHEARKDNIQQAKITLVKLSEVKEKIGSKTKELKKSLTTQQKEKAKLEDDYLSRATIIKELENDISDKSSRLNTLIENEQALRALLKEINIIMPSLLTEVDKRKPFAQRRGRLSWPVRGKVKNLFGKSRQVSSIKWNGVMIRSAEGRDVKAVSHGRVAYADWLRGYGMLIIVDHGDGYMTLYGHNQALYKETGDWVDEGDIIAAVGKSGGHATAGLYFEIRNNGQPSNPVLWCKR